jgi:hypothetical protein
MVPRLASFITLSKTQRSYDNYLLRAYFLPPTDLPLNPNPQRFLSAAPPWEPTL